MEKTIFANDVKLKVFMSDTPEGLEVDFENWQVAYKNSYIHDMQYGFAMSPCRYSLLIVHNEKSYR